MINCGGTRDMSDYWFASETHEIMCLLIDVHRPTHHNNINITRSIVLIDDGKYELENCPKDEDRIDFEEEDDDYDYEDNNENEEEKDLDYQEDTNKISVKKEEADSKPNIVKKENEEMMVDMSNEDKIIVDNKQDIPTDKQSRRLKKKKDNIPDLDTISEELNENIEVKKENKVEDIVNQVSLKKTKKSAILDEKLIKKRIKMKKIKKFRAYYSGNYFGYPASYIFYKIASQLHREDSQTLWYLIMALTDHYLQSHINQTVYDILYTECHSEVLRLNKNKSHSNISNFSSNIHKIKKEDNKNNPNIESDSKLMDYTDVVAKTTNREVGTIIVDPDYRLFLYRHWSLFDSFIYSNYTLGKLLTWKEPGKAEIKKMLTYIGIPLDESKQKYSFMKNDYKDLFKSKITQISQIFDLKDLIFPSFIYQFDQRTQLSASDFTHCINAILNYPFNLNNLNDEIGWEDGKDEINKEEKNDENVGNNNKDQNEKKNKMNNKFDHFWAAYDFLSLKNPKMLKTAIELAIKFQIAVVSNGTKILDKRSITPSRDFRYAIINSDISEDTKYFHYPLSLEKLALFVMDTFHTSRVAKINAIKPFVLAIYNSKNKSYLAAGVLGSARQYENEKNQFSIRFGVCARKVGANLVFNNFDDCIVEVPRDDFLQFLDEVCMI